jgi:hypothetical protein
VLRGDSGYFRPLALDTHADSPIWAHILLIKVLELKEERHAVILAHNCQTPDIFHTIADSLALAREARVPRPMSPCCRASISWPKPPGS